MLISLSFLVSAKVDIDIQSVTLEEPINGVVADKDSISIKATIGNLGDVDWTTPYYVKIYVNDKLHTSCSKECELNGIPVSDGLVAGQLADIFWGVFCNRQRIFKTWRK